jgi:predicted RNA methylase
VRTLDLFRRGLREEAHERGWPRAVSAMIARIGEVVRDSFPDRRRMRFGDIQYDIDHRVNTTWANVGFRTRLREALISADYQTTDPVIFAEAMERIRSEFRVPSSKNWTFAEFTFVDLGSGKGRVLLMAAEYDFRRIIGVELLPELHAIALENVARDSRIELILGDARDFAFPHEPLVVFFFNPFPVWILRTVLGNLQKSLKVARRPTFVVLHNPVYEAEMTTVNSIFRRVSATEQFAIYEHLGS